MTGRCCELHRPQNVKFRKHSAPPTPAPGSSAGQEGQRWERALESAFPRNPSKDPGNCSEFETLGREAQPTLNGEQPNENGGQPSPATPQAVPPRAPPQPVPPPSPRAMANVTGQTSRSLRMSPGLKGQGSPHACLLPPWASLQIGISENGFHNSVSGNQLFTTSLPTNS